MDDTELSKIRKRIANGELNITYVGICPVPLAVFYDMIWQKRAGGRVYDFLSEHGFLIDCRSGKVVHFDVKNTCQQYNDIQNEIPAHRCNVYHKGSSGSMESALARSKVDDLYRKILRTHLFMKW